MIKMPEKTHWVAMLLKWIGIVLGSSWFIFIVMFWFYDSSTTFTTSELLAIALIPSFLFVGVGIWTSWLVDGLKRQTE